MSIELNTAISHVIEQKLKSHLFEKLTTSTCVNMYTDIFNSLVDIMTESNVKIGNEAMNYLAQQYYDAITITSNGTAHELDPNIFDKRAKLENIETKEIALLATMMSGTPFAIPMIHEIKRRS